MELKDLVFKAHAMAREKGWHDGAAHPPLVRHMLIVSEVAEATEAVRNNEKPLWFAEGGKPEGEMIELADAVIRIADLFGLMGWDLEKAIALKMDFNATRPHRHGGKSA